MQAVIKIGGKQQRVKQGDVIEAEFQKGEQPGETMKFKPLLVIDDEGKALHGKDISGATVVAKVVGHQKGEKVEVVKFRPKTRYTRRTGHRQMHSLLEITEVGLGKRAAASSKTADKAEPEPKAEAAEKPAAAKAEAAQKPAVAKADAPAKPAAEEAEAEETSEG